MKFIRKAIAIFRVKPILFLALIALAILSVASGDMLPACLFFIVLVSEARIVMLESKVKILTLIAGAGVGLVAATFGGLFNE